MVRADWTRSEWWTSPSFAGLTRLNADFFRNKNGVGAGVCCELATIPSFSQGKEENIVVVALQRDDNGPHGCWGIES